MTEQEFIDKYKWAAIWNHIKYGVPGSITLAQAIIESNSGNSYLSRIGNNFFGIKAYSNPDNLPIIYADDDTKHEPFRSYPNAASSFADHSKFLLLNPRYMTAITAGNYVDYTNALKADGYATNPNYAQTLQSTIEKNNLTKYDTYGNNKILFILLFLLILTLLGFFIHYLVNYGK